MRYLILAALIAGCERLPEREPATGGNPAHGKALVLQFGCGACHTIRGLPNATGIVGPPLQDMKKRVYLGGVVSNSPEQIVKWIVNPREYASNTAMPALGVSEEQARDIAAYLYLK